MIPGPRMPGNSLVAAGARLRDLTRIVYFCVHTCTRMCF